MSKHNLEEIEELETEEEQEEVKVIGEDKWKALKSLEEKLSKNIGSNYLPITKEAERETVIFLPTGVYAIDKTLGGGIPLGRCILLYGHESSGKSTFAAKCVEAFQKEGKVAFYADVESGLDFNFMSMCGVDIEKLGVIQSGETMSAEKFLDQLELVAKSGIADLIVLDSIAALTASKELEEDSIGDQNMALLARTMSKFYRKITPILREKNCTLLCINQYRSSLSLYGSPNALGGGKAQHYYSSIKIELKRDSKPITIKDIPIGIGVRIKTDKNKVGIPFLENNFKILYPYTDQYGELKAGIDLFEDNVDAIIAEGVVETSGAWIYIDDNKFQGKPKFIEYLKENPKVFKELKDKLYNKMKN